MDIHQIYSSFQKWPLLFPNSYKKQSWSRGRVSDYGSKGPRFSSWSFLFFFFPFGQWKSKKIHQTIDEFPSKIWRIFIKWILEILQNLMKFCHFWWNFNIFLNIKHQIEMNLHQRMTNWKHSFYSVVSSQFEVLITVMFQRRG